MRGNREAGCERGGKGRWKERKEAEDGRRHNRHKVVVETCAVLSRDCRYDIQFFLFPVSCIGNC